MAGITIGGADGRLDRLESFSVEIFDLDSDDTARNAKGDMLRDRLAVKRKLSFKYVPLTDGEISSILSAISLEFVNVSYPDPVAGGARTGSFYAGNRSAPVLFKTDQGYLWRDLSFTLTEQ